MNIYGIICECYGPLTGRKLVYWVKTSEGKIAKYNDYHYAISIAANLETHKEELEPAGMDRRYRVKLFPKQRGEK